MGIFLQILKSPLLWKEEWLENVGVFCTDLSPVQRSCSWESWGYCLCAGDERQSHYIAGTSLPQAHWPSSAADFPSPPVYAAVDFSAH